MKQGRRIYLDYSATAPVRPEAKAAALAAIEAFGNPSSVHHEGRAARELLEGAREAVARLAGASPGAVTFTSGASEANSWVISALARGGFIRSLIVSAIEHDSVLAPAEAARAHGLTLLSLPVHADGRARAEDLDALLAEAPAPALIALMAVNNETGVVQPVAQAALAAKRMGALLLVDAVQAAGRIPVRALEEGADFVTLSAHKIGGLKGAGALIAAAGAPLPPLVLGGRQELGRRAGTEALPAIAAFGAAADAAASLLYTDRIARAQETMEAALARAVPGLVIHGAASKRAPGISSFGVPGLKAETGVIALDLAGFAVSAGSACSSGKVKRSHVLTAMGLGADAAASAIRVSFGAETGEGDLLRLVDAYTDHAARAGLAGVASSNELMRA